MKKIFILFSVLSLFLATNAQTGYLKGTILDKTNNEALIGANVLVPSLPGVGTISDFDGSYSLKLQPGVYTVTYSFISYETKTLENIIIKGGETTSLDVTLGEASVDVGEVVVSAEVVRRSESSMMIMQKKASGVMDGISMEQISKLGDGNAASALKRVTGISVQGGKYVFVRGLGERYTKTTLNSAEIPGLDPEKNSVQMDLFPSSIIQNITVKKTFTPDMPSESTGGQVDIVTRDFPDELSLTWSSSFTFNTQSSFNKNFLSYNTPVSDWFGFDNGSRAIPSSVQTVLDDMAAKNIEQLNIVYYSYDELGDISKAFNKEVAPMEKMSFMDQSHKFTVGNQTDFLNKPLGFNFSLSYSNDYDYYENGVFGNYNGAISSADKILSDRVGNHSTKIASLLNFSYKLNDQNRVGIRFVNNMGNESTSRYRIGHYYYEGPQTFMQERNLSYLQRAFSSTQINGKHTLNNQHKLEWGASFTLMTQNEPDARFYTNLFEPYSGDTLYRIQTNSLPSRIYRDFKEYNFDNRVDYELPLNILGENSKLKFGASYLYKRRDASQNKFELRSDNAVYLGNVQLDGNYNVLLDNIISSDNINGVFYTADINNDLINSYYAFQTVASAYGMADFALGSKLRIVTGARLEKLLIETENLISQNDAKYAKGTLPQTNILPSVNISYKIIDDMNLRVAFSRTLARPLFKEIAPQSFYDYKAGMRVNGNPDLKEAKIDNLDFRYEYFFNRGEMFAFSAFYKHFTNPIEMRLSAASANFEVTYDNSEESYLYGIEAELRKSLDFIVSGLSLGANYTYVKSVVEIQKDLQDLRDAKTRPMVGQAPYVINTYFSYSNQENGWDANIGFNVSGKKLMLITELATPYIYELPEPALNFNVSKNIGEHLGIEFSADNILNSEFRAVYDYEEYLDHRRYSKGRAFSFGIKYKL